MKYPKRYTRIITEYYSSLRAKEEQDQILRCRIARKDPEFRQAEKAFSEASLTFARAKILSNSYADERKKYENAKQKLNNICENKGYDLTLHIHCKKCQDTGFIGEELCSCALPMYFDLLKQDFGTKNIPKISFENNRINEINCLQKHSLAILYDRMQDLCDKFYTTEKLTILITGQSGTGKTTLAYTMANELIKNGISVCFITAFEFNDLMLRYHTSKIEAKSQYMNFILDCEMLIIDDLGTEPILKNVTKEYLYNVVDTRIVRGKKTMITSNLDLEELMLRYGERTVSRMTNKSYSVTRELLGDDLRKFRF